MNQLLTGLKISLAIAVASTVSTACSDNSGASDRDAVALARREIIDNNFDSAARILNSTVKNLGDSVKSPKTLGEIAVLYMIIDEHETEDGYNAKALDLYRRAVEANADSVNALFSELERSDARYLFVLKNLDAQNGGDIDFTEFEEEYFEEEEI